MFLMIERLGESLFWRETTQQSAVVDCRRHHHPINNQPGTRAYALYPNHNTTQQSTSNHCTHPTVPVGPYWGRIYGLSRRDYELLAPVCNRFYDMKHGGMMDTSRNNPHRRPTCLDIEIMYSKHARESRSNRPVVTTRSERDVAEDQWISDDPISVFSFTSNSSKFLESLYQQQQSYNKRKGNTNKDRLDSRS
jgi:hypothetical protein